MARKSKPDKKPGQGPIKDADLVPEDYEKFLRELKERIRRTQFQAAVAANRELLELYWHIGKSVVERQKTKGTVRRGSPDPAVSSARVS